MKNKEQMNSTLETVAPFREVIKEIKEAGGEVFKLCYQCGKCDVVCPWNKVRNFSIRKIIREASFGLTQIESEDIWRCTTCGMCTQQCPRGVKQIDLGVSLRRIASEYGVFPAAVQPARTVRGSLLTRGNPLDGEREKRADWMTELPVKLFSEEMEILFFGCCYLSYDPRMKRIANATASILNKAGINWGILGTKENCCGESIRKTGAESVYKSLAKENIKTFVDFGVKKIVVSSPHCYHSLANEYPEFMMNFKVVHITQFLSELIQNGRLATNGIFKRKVTYHDPCYLGRHNGIFDEPREVLKQVPGLVLTEMDDSRSNSLCCGGGGGRIWMDTATGERFSDIRLEQAIEVGAEILVTACPYCITMFEDSRLKLKYEDKILIKDITEIVQQVM